MPLYEYECEDCGIQEHFHWLSNDTPTIECPGCGKPAKKVIVSAATICDRSSLRIPKKGRQKLYPN